MLEYILYILIIANSPSRSCVCVWCQLYVWLAHWSLWEQQEQEQEQEQEWFTGLKFQSISFRNHSSWWCNIFLDSWNVDWLACVTMSSWEKSAKDLVVALIANTACVMCVLWCSLHCSSMYKVIVPKDSSSLFLFPNDICNLPQRYSMVCLWIFCIE
jgi:hypothetical protein